jgi:hypothetical protein
VYIWPILQPSIEVTSSAIIKETIQPVLDGSKDAFVWPVWQPRIEV